MFCSYELNLYICTATTKIRKPIFNWDHILLIERHKKCVSLPLRKMYNDILLGGSLRTCKFPFKGFLKCCSNGDLPLFGLIATT